ERHGLGGQAQDGGMTEPAASTTARPAPADLPFRLLGLVWVLTGGLTAAVTGPLGLEHGSWSAAFQVLVRGVLQGVLGIAPPGPPAAACSWPSCSPGTSAASP